MDPLIPRKPKPYDPPRPVAIHIEQRIEPQYWAEMRETLGELSLLSKLCPDQTEEDRSRRPPA